MGNKSPSSQQSPQIINKHWQPINKMLWRNKATGEVIKQKRIMFRSQQQMKYVFGCLLRRMNDYHSGVVKVFYLRKCYQKGSICNCMEGYSIQVYVENVGVCLQQYVNTKIINSRKAYNKSGTNKTNFYTNSNKKCVCVQIMNAALYLRQKYGCFVIDTSNVWVQQPVIQHTVMMKNNNQQQQQQRPQSSSSMYVPSSSSSSQSISSQQQQQQHHNKPNKKSVLPPVSISQQPQQPLKTKLWISSQQQQNYPDKSCDQKEMCTSIVRLIKDVLIMNKLCTCYQSGQQQQNILSSLLLVNTMAQLLIMMRGLSQRRILATKNNQNIKTTTNSNNKLQPNQHYKYNPQHHQQQFTRTLRSFSSQDASSSPPLLIPHQHYQQQHQQSYFTNNNNNLSIPNNNSQYYRSVQKNQYINNHLPSSSSQRKYSSIQYGRKSVVKNQYINTNVNISNVNNLTNNTKVSQQGRLLSQQLTTKCVYQQHQNKSIHMQNLRTQIINSRNNYRQHQGNNLINLPIISIADMTGQGNNSVKISDTYRIQSVIKPQQQAFKQNQIQIQIKNKTKNQLSITPQQQFIIKQLKNNKKINTQSVRYKRSTTSRCQAATRQISTINHINNNSNSNKIKQTYISNERVTSSPTDRTKYDKSQLQLKQDQRNMQQQATINTSRKNISIIPISMQSTSGAGSILKPIIIHSNDNLNKISPYQQQRQFSQQLLTNQNNNQRSNQSKKQSASSSKSEKNCYKNSYEQNQSLIGMVIEKKKNRVQNNSSVGEQKRIVIKKRMSDSIVGRVNNNNNNNNDSSNNTNDKQIVIVKQDNDQRIKIQLDMVPRDEEVKKVNWQLQQQQSNQQNIHTFNIVKPNILAPTTSMTNKKKYLTSLALMEYKFGTDDSIEESIKMGNHNYNGHEQSLQVVVKQQKKLWQQVSIRQCLDAGQGQLYSQQVMQTNNFNNTITGQQLKSIKKQSLKDQISESLDSSSVRQSQLREVEFQLHTFNKIQLLSYENNNDTKKSSRQKRGQIKKQQQVNGYSNNKINNNNNNNKINKNNNTIINQSLSLFQLIKRQQQQPHHNYYQQQYQSSLQHNNNNHIQYQISINKQQKYFYQNDDDKLSEQKYFLEKQKQMSHPVLIQASNMVKKLSLKEEFSQLLNNQDHHEQQNDYYNNAIYNNNVNGIVNNKVQHRAKTYNKQSKSNRLKQLPHNDGKQAVSIYNQSEYNQSQDVSKRPSLKDFMISKQQHHHIPSLKISKRNREVISTQRNNPNTTRPNNNNIVEKQLSQQKMLLRLTSSGHEDNSIKQKVISKKAEFAQLKDEMNSLLL